MIELPIAFVIPFVSVLMVVAIGPAPWLPHRARLFFLIFLLLLAAMGTLIGIRYGYEFEAMAMWQPPLAMALPASLYLGFFSLTLDPQPSSVHVGARHGWAILLVVAVIIMPFDLPMPIDLFVFTSMGVYLIKLIELFRSGPDRFIHVTNEGYGIAKTGLGVSICLISFVLFIDLAIFTSRRFQDATRSESLVQLGTTGIALAIALIATLSVFQLARRSTSSRAQTGLGQRATKNLDVLQPTSHDIETLAALESLMQNHQLYRDSGLTLARTARRLGRPVRDVSHAVNRCRSKNFSRFVNQKRVDYAKNMLTSSQTSITEIMLEAGFITKSNFNAEFFRITSMTPTQFRDMNSKT